MFDPPGGQRSILKGRVIPDHPGEPHGVEVTDVFWAPIESEELREEESRGIPTFEPIDGSFEFVFDEKSLSRARGFFY